MKLSTFSIKKLLNRFIKVNLINYLGDAPFYNDFSPKVHKRKKS